MHRMCFEWSIAVANWRAPLPPDLHEEAERSRATRFMISVALLVYS